MLPNRLDPSDIAPEALADLSAVLERPGHVSIIDDEGRRADLPDVLLEHLGRVVRLMAEHRAVALLPEGDEMTTQAAAGVLGVSRQHLVDLLESGQIPFHRVGTHRRVGFQDLAVFQKRRDGARREALDRLAKTVGDAGLYDASYTGDA